MFTDLKILIQYIRPSGKLLGLAMLLAAVNQCFSLLDPLITGKLIDKLGVHKGD
jgi:ATP-binding cassette, subfamily B, bacterial